MFVLVQLYLPTPIGDVDIPDDITYTVNTKVNGDKQFTFTCTSTGGPATTVTWTRDSNTLLGGKTVLDDPVTAKYTHTLTVTETPLQGLYQCTVANNKPSTVTKNFMFEGNKIMI